MVKQRASVRKGKRFKLIVINGIKEKISNKTSQK